MVRLGLLQWVERYFAAPSSQRLKVEITDVSIGEISAPLNPFSSKRRMRVRCSPGKSDRANTTASLRDNDMIGLYCLPRHWTAIAKLLLHGYPLTRQYAIFLNMSRDGNWDYSRL